MPMAREAGGQDLAQVLDLHPGSGFVQAGDGQWPQMSMARGAGGLDLAQVLELDLAWV